MKTNNLKYTTTIVKNNGENLVVKIRLNDECKNGHQDFAITADLYKGKGRTERSYLAGGCLHDEINKFAPKFKQFVKLHLSDCEGVPMHAVANGFYHMREGFNDKTKNQKTEFCNYYRIAPLQYDELKKAKDEKYFGFLLVQLGILTQWKNEAEEAIKMLEQLTENEFLNDSVKSQFSLNSEDLEAVKNKVSDGFYTDEAIQERELKKAKDEKEKIINDLRKDRDEKINKIDTEFKIKMFVLKAGLSINNFIYYSHTNEGRFNWKDYDKKISESEFKKFCKCNFENLPQGIKFSIQDLKIEYSPI